MKPFFVHGVGLEPEDFYVMAHAPAARANAVGDGKGRETGVVSALDLLLYGNTACRLTTRSRPECLNCSGPRLEPERLAQPVDRAERLPIARCATHCCLANVVPSCRISRWDTGTQTAVRPSVRSINCSSRW